MTRMDRSKPIPNFQSSILSNQDSQVEDEGNTDGQNANLDGQTIFEHEQTAPFVSQSRLFVVIRRRVTMKTF